LNNNGAAAMKIHFIGTGSAHASLERNHAAVLISAEERSLLVDAGDGISRALLRESVTFDTIDAVLISHLHPDHYSGIIALIAQMKLYKREKPLTIFLPDKDIHFIEEYFKHSYIFLELLSFTITFQPIPINNPFQPFEGLEVMAKENSHLLEKKGCYAKDDISFQSFSFLFSANTINLFHSCDVGSEADLYLFRDSKIDYLLTEITHIEPDAVLRAAKFFQPHRIFITHLTEEDVEQGKTAVANCSFKLQSDILFCKDGMEFILK
jgi:ribonuclease Z